VDQGTLVEDRIVDGRRFVERFAADGNSVRAAAWVKTAEEGLWFLYLATEIIDQVGPAAAYRAVHGSLKKLEDLPLNGSQIKLVGPSNPIAVGLQNIANRSPVKLSTRFGAETLGSLAVDQGYVYSPHLFRHTRPNPMTTEDLGQRIAGLMSRGAGILQPSRINLKDGNSFSGVPFSLNFGGQNNGLMVQFVVDREPTPRTYRVDEIASIA